MIERHPNIVIPFSLAFILSVFAFAIWWGTGVASPVPLFLFCIIATLLICAFTYDYVTKPVVVSPGETGEPVESTFFDVVE